MDTPHLRLEDTGETLRAAREVTTVGRGARRRHRPGRPDASRACTPSWSAAARTSTSPTSACRPTAPASTAARSAGGVLDRRRRAVLRRRPHPRRRPGAARPADDTVELRRISAPDLTRRELEVLTALCRPALQQDAFVAPATAKDIADELVVTEAAVKQHLLRLYQKFRIAEGVNRRARLANEVISAGVVRPLPADVEARDAAARAEPLRPARRSAASTQFLNSIAHRRRARPRRRAA